MFVSIFLLKNKTLEKVILGAPASTFYRHGSSHLGAPGAVSANLESELCSKILRILLLFFLVARLNLFCSLWW